MPWGRRDAGLVGSDARPIDADPERVSPLLTPPPRAVGAGAAQPAAGSGEGAQVASAIRPALRAGSAPSSRYRAIVASTQWLPDRESAWVTPPGSASSRALGNRERTSRLPSYGVAASSVWSTSSGGGASLPSMGPGGGGFAGQVRHGMLNQVFSHVWKLARVAVLAESRSQVEKPVGHEVSVHSTAR